MADVTASSAHSPGTAPAQTLAQKLVARAAGRDHVVPGEIVTCRVDLAMMHDSGGPRRVGPMLAQLRAQVWDPSRVVIITDHYVPARDDESRRIVAIAREFAAARGVRRLHDEMGICHVVLPEQGHLKPGMFVVGGDSHSPTGGAFGCYMFGIGATEMTAVLVTGEIWLRVPHTIRIEWDGAFGDGVAAKDAMLHAITALGMDGGRYEAVEYAGSAVRGLSMRERMTMANMTAELGGQTGLFTPDATTREFLADAGVDEVDLDTWQGDAGAAMLATHRFDASALAPQVAAPHSPANAAAVDAHAGTRITAAYIGACTGAKLDDLRMAARVLRGRRRAADVRLMVAPASLRDQEIARGEGVLQALLDAGAELLPTACGACAGYGVHRFADDDVVISSTARNFRGRMGAPGSRVYLASPYTVAASAVAGAIADPRDFL
ncbi:MAG: aconitase/3-isopropylmalate dehydratase large subunit family protein [Burkholderiales bacterium]